MNNNTSVLISTFIFLLVTFPVYWLTSTHYQEILREKDASFWEHLGRAQTQGLHSENQCKRLIENTNHFSKKLVEDVDQLNGMLLTKCMENLKTQLETDCTVQPPIERHIYRCQELHTKLVACNRRLTIQIVTNKRLAVRSSRQQHSVVHTSKLLSECEFSEKSSNINTFSFGEIIMIVMVVTSSIFVLSKLMLASDESPITTKRLPAPARKKEREQLTDKCTATSTKIHKNVQTAGATHYTEERQLLIQQLKDHKRSLKEQTHIKYRLKKQITELREKLAKNNTSILNQNRELKESRQTKEQLKRQIDMLETMIAKLNEELNKYKKMVEQKTQETREMQIQLSKQTTLLQEEEDGKMQQIKKVNSELEQKRLKLKKVFLRDQQLVLMGKSINTKGYRTKHKERDQTIRRVFHEKYEQEHTKHDIKDACFKMQAGETRWELKPADLAHENDKLRFENAQQSAVIEELTRRNKELTKKKEYFSTMSQPAYFHLSPTYISFN